MSSSNKVPQEITTFQADDTTYFEWSPDGEHLLTATTAPRLRVSNGFVSKFTIKSGTIKIFIEIFI